MAEEAQARKKYKFTGPKDPRQATSAVDMGDGRVAGAYDTVELTDAEAEMLSETVNLEPVGEGATNDGNDKPYGTSEEKAAPSVASESAADQAQREEV